MIFKFRHQKNKKSRKLKHFNIHHTNSSRCSHVEISGYEILINFPVGNKFRSVIFYPRENLVANRIPQTRNLT